MSAASTSMLLPPSQPPIVVQKGCQKSLASSWCGTSSSHEEIVESREYSIYDMYCFNLLYEFTTFLYKSQSKNEFKEVIPRVCVM